MTIYFNFHPSNHIVETIDQISDKDFQTHKEFIAEKKRLLKEYHSCGINVYLSQRCTNEWRNK